MSIRKPAIKRYIIVYPDKEPLVAFIYKLAMFSTPLALYAFAVFYLVNPTYFKYTKIIYLMSDIDKFSVDYVFLNMMYGEHYAKYFLDYLVVSTFIYIFMSIISIIFISFAVIRNGVPVESNDSFNNLAAFLLLVVVLVGIFVLPTPFNDADSADRFGVPVNSYGILIVPVLFAAGNMFGIFATVLVVKYIKFRFIKFFRGAENGK